MNEGDLRGQQSTKAILNGNAAKKRRKEAKHRGDSERHEKAIRNIGSKGPNMKFQIFNKRKHAKFHVLSEKASDGHEKGKGKGNGKGKGKGKGKGHRGKGWN